MNVNEDIVRRLTMARAVPVLRCADADEAVRIGRALADGGLTVIEVTYTTPDAPTAIRRLSEDIGLTVGAGTVLTPDDARRACDAGAAFLVSPVWTPWLPDVAAQRGAAAIPGAATPSEIWRAHESGVAAVKVFPIARLGGAAYVRDLLAPLPDLRIMATGGVTTASAKGLLSAGCIAVGLGSAHSDPSLGDTVAARARRVRDELLDDGLRDEEDR